MAEFIVAIELGSSAIRGIAGKKNLDGSFSVLAFAKEDASQCIRKGVVNNIDKTANCLKNIVTKLSKAVKQRITRVYVGIGGQSVRSVRNVIVKDLPSETIINSAVVNELMDTNRNMNYPEFNILDAVTQEYKIGNQYVLDPVGIKGTRVEGNFLNILQRKSFYNSLNSCFGRAGLAIAEIKLAPLVLADSVLTDTEKRVGCVLVDWGFDTTTVSVYYKGVLRHLAVIPLGGNNITKDITSLRMEEREAENLKLKHASAYTESADIDPSGNYDINGERSVECRKLIELVEARVQEIIENVWCQMPGEYMDKIQGGIIITGGGSNLKDIELAFKKYTRVDKIRKARFVNFSVKSSNDEINKHDATLNTLLALLAKGDMNCAGEPIGSNSEDLFGSAPTGRPIVPEEPQPPVGSTLVTPVPGGDGGKNEPKVTPEPKEEEKKPAKRGFFERLRKGLTTFGGKVFEAEE